MTSGRPTIAGVIAARMGSTRLPGKALMPIDGVPLVGRVIDRALRLQGLDALAVATSDREIDDQLAAYAEKRGVRVYRGSPDDVALRLLECAESLGADYFLRLNGDSPFIDSELVDLGMRHLDEGYDLITNILERSFPYGVSLEIVRTLTLRDALPLMSDSDREHVTPYLYAHRDGFHICSLMSEYPELKRARMVVDTEDDLRALERVVDALGESAWEAGYRRLAEEYLRIGHVIQ